MGGKKLLVRLAECRERPPQRDPRREPVTNVLRGHHDKVAIGPRAHVVHIERDGEGERQQVDERHEHVRDHKGARQIAARIAHLRRKRTHGVVPGGVP